MSGLNMRSSKMKILVYCGVIGGLLLTIYLLSSTHSRLKEIKGVYDSCQQQKDSLLAQLQVVYEQKNRVEKALQQEKVDHRKTKEDSLQANQLKGQLEKEKLEAENRYNILQQEQQVVQEKQTQLQNEANQLKEKLSQMEEELHHHKDEKENIALNKESEITKLKSELKTLQNEKEQLQILLESQRRELDQKTEETHNLIRTNKQLESQMKELNNLDTGKKDVKDDTNARNIESPDIKKVTTLATKPIKGEGILNNVGGGGGDTNLDKGADVINNALPNNQKENENPQAVNAVEPIVKDPMIAAVPDQNQKTISTPSSIVKSEMDKQLQDRALNKNVLPKPLSPPKENNIQDLNIDQVRENQGEIEPREDNRFHDKDHKILEPHHPLEPHHLSGSRNFHPLNDNGEPLGGMAHWGQQSLKRGPQLKPPGQMVGQAGNQPGEGNLNHQAGEEEDNYRDEGGDDDAAEEQDPDDGVPVGEKVNPPKAFQDHDFEDNVDGGDQNHAREEGIVVAPK